MTVFQHNPADYPNVTLLRSGFLGSSPTHPTVAIHISVLDYYRQLHRECPRLSIQAQVKALCHLHRVSQTTLTVRCLLIFCQVLYYKDFSRQFSTAFDVYLSILSEVDQRINTRLGHVGPDWRMKTVCPPCFYQLEGEPQLKFSLLCTMDGNSSLKHVADDYRFGVVQRDERTCGGSMVLPPAMVDRFKDEVKSTVSGIQLLLGRDLFVICFSAVTTIRGWMAFATAG